MAPKSDAERKRAERVRMRERGYVLKQFWVHPEDWPQIAKYLDRINKQRAA
jgi:hypothetical protein